MQLTLAGPTGKILTAGRLFRELSSFSPKYFSAALVESSFSVFFPTIASASVREAASFILSRFAAMLRAGTPTRLKALYRLNGTAKTKDPQAPKRNALGFNPDPFLPYTQFNPVMTGLVRSVMYKSAVKHTSNK
jgi:hypothetical protein